MNRIECLKREPKGESEAQVDASGSPRETNDGGPLKHPHHIRCLQPHEKHIPSAHRAAQRPRGHAPLPIPCLRHQHNQAVRTPGGTTPNPLGFKDVNDRRPAPPARRHAAACRKFDALEAREDANAASSREADFHGLTEPAALTSGAAGILSAASCAE